MSLTTKICRIFYCLIILFAGLTPLAFYLFLRRGGGESMMGIHLLFPAFFVALEIISLVLTLLFWWFGFWKKSRFPRTILLVGVVAIFWPLPFLVTPLTQTLPFLIEAWRTTKVYQAKSGGTVVMLGVQPTDSKNLEQVVINQVVENPLMIGQQPIGLHMEMDMDVPVVLASIPSGKQESFCTRDINNWGLLWSYFSSDIKRQQAFLVDLNKSRSCTDSTRNGMTHIHWASNSFPFGVRYVQEDMGKICMNAEQLPSSLSDDMTKFHLGLHFTNQTLAFDKINNQAPKSDIAAGVQLGQHITMMSDPAFWQLAYRAVQPNQLLGSGYHTCDTAYPGYLQGDHVTCYCR